MKNSIRFVDYVSSPIGKLQIVASKLAVVEIRFVDRQTSRRRSNGLTDVAVDQLSEFFQGKRRDFDLKLELQGTDFQQDVWNELAKIRFGQTCSYQDVATEIGRPKAVRAVGAANGRNPISIVVPCHRVIGSNGRLTGYAGGLHRKEWLLNHEGVCLDPDKKVQAVLELK